VTCAAILISNIIYEMAKLT